jgi:hypothetical protein
VVVKIRFTSPRTHKLSVGGRTFEPKIHADDTTAMVGDPAREASWDNFARTLYFVVKGGETVEIITLDSVQVSLTLATTVADFYDQGGPQTFLSNVAYSLGIPASRIRITSVPPRPLTRRRRDLLSFGRRLAAEPVGVVVDFAIVEEVKSPPPPSPQPPPSPPPAALDTPSPPPSPPPPPVSTPGDLAEAQAAAARAMVGLTPQDPQGLTPTHRRYRKSVKHIPLSLTPITKI